MPAEVINHAVSLGVTYIGENKVQELCAKYDALDTDHCHVHFIGHLQTNKVRQVVDKVEMIQSVDSLKLAKEISKACLARQKTMDVLIEVNIGREENKSGVLPEGLIQLVEEVSHTSGNFRPRVDGNSPCERENNRNTRIFFRYVQKFS